MRSNLLKNGRHVACAGALALALYGGMSSAWAQSAPPIGDVLAERFRLLADSCFGKNTYAQQFYPTGIATHSKRGEANYLHLEGVSFSGLSTVEFSEKSDLAEARHPPGDRVIAVRLDEDNVAVNSYWDSLKYSFSCTSALKTAIDAGLELTPLFGALSGKTVNVSAGLQAEASNSANSGLVVIYGRLESPLSKLANDQHDLARRMRGRSALWLASSPRPTGKSYLDYIEGWLVSSTTASNAEHALRVDEKASVHALVLNGDWASSASVKYTSDFSAQKFDIYVMPKAPGDAGRYPYAYNLFAMPKVEELSADLSAAAMINPSSATAADAVGNKVQYIVSVPGLDRVLCTGANEWRGSIAAPDFVSATTGRYDDKTSTCDLTVVASVHDLPAARQATLTITNVGHQVSGQSVQASFPISYRTAAYPTIRAIDARLEARGEPEVRLSTDVALSLLAEPGTNMAGVVVLQDTTLTCSGGTAATAQSTFTPTPQPTVHTEFRFVDRTAFPNGRCLWSAHVQFDDGPQHVAERVVVQYELAVTPALLSATPPRSL